MRPDQSLSNNRFAVFTLMQVHYTSFVFATVVYTTFSIRFQLGYCYSTTDECVNETVKLVKEKRTELASDFCLTNRQSSDSLLRICEYYIPHKIHKVLRMVSRESCNTKIPTIKDLEESIYSAYVQLLGQLKTYEETLNVRIF